jgi:hypothetical protein
MKERQTDRTKTRKKEQKQASKKERPDHERGV